MVGDAADDLTSACSSIRGRERARARARAQRVAGRREAPQKRRKTLRGCDSGRSSHASAFNPFPTFILAHLRWADPATPTPTPISSHSLVASRIWLRCTARYKRSASTKAVARRQSCEDDHAWAGQGFFQRRGPAERPPPRWAGPPRPGNPPRLLRGTGGGWPPRPRTHGVARAGPEKPDEEKTTCARATRARGARRPGSRRHARRAGKRRG